MQVWKMSIAICNKDMSFAVNLGTSYLDSMEEYSVSSSRDEWFWRKSNNSYSTGLAFLQFIAQLYEEKTKKGQSLAC